MGGKWLKGLSLGATPQACQGKGEQNLNVNDKHDRQILQNIAHRAMRERGLQPEFSTEALAELNKIREPAVPNGAQVRDLTRLLWCSIDNEDSLDLDQLTLAEARADNRIKIQVAIADVDALVKKGSPIDEHACQNTVSVYTAAEIFPMLPEKLSTNLTSLSFDQDRLAVVVEMVVDSDGTVDESAIYRALVHNHAKLAYNDVAAWLEGGGVPDEVAAVPGLAENLRLQDRAAQRLKQFRQSQGALRLETIKARPVFDGDKIEDLGVDAKNRAKEIIEDFMIAANGVTARYLESKNLPSLRRVVRTPKRWERIVQIAHEYRYNLPEQPDSLALDKFLIKQKAADPLRFPDLSLAIVKLLGSGEYAADFPGEVAPGHFGLAVKDYAHSTAPNRRYPDLITQRLLKAALAGRPSPYGRDEMIELARHCTEQEDDASKVERLVDKSAAALLLEDRIGEQFDAVVTGASSKGTWVRLLNLPVEGMLVEGSEGADVGDRIHVQLIGTDVERGFIDFKKVSAFKRRASGRF